MNNETHQYINVYRNQFIIAFVLKFVFVHFRQKILEITKHYKTNFNMYIYIYIKSCSFMVSVIKSFNKQTQNLVLFFLYFFSIMVEPQNNPIIINVFPLTQNLIAIVIIESN